GQVGLNADSPRNDARFCDRRAFQGIETVVTAELFQAACPQPVNPTIASPEHRGTGAAQEEHRNGASAMVQRVRTSRRPQQDLVAPPDPLRGALHGFLEGAGRLEILKRVADHPTRHLSITVSAHTISDRPQPDVRSLDETIFVVVAGATYVGGRRGSE